MKQALHIVPECFVDTILVETLLDLEQCNHQSGISNVLSVINRKLKDSFAIGVVDDDKRKPTEYYNYLEICESENFKILRDKNSPFHFLIVIKPAQEVFILKNVEKSGKKMSDFNLPDTLESLKEKTKSRISKNDPDLKRLFKTLMQEGEVKLLKEILVYLNETKYRYDEAVLQEML